MSSKRGDTAYLYDIIVAIEKIWKYTKGLTFEEFLLDEKTVDAVCRNLEIIGEAAKYISKDLRDRHKNIPWREIIALRNRIIHEYFGVDEEIIWQIIKHDLAPLYKGLKEILKSLQGGFK